MSFCTLEDLLNELGRQTGLGLGTLLIVFLCGAAIALFYLILWWRILSKAGYPGALSLLPLILPGLMEFIFLLILAFGDWPILRELRSLRDGAYRLSSYYPGSSRPPE